MTLHVDLSCNSSNVVLMTFLWHVSVLGSIAGGPISCLRSDATHSVVDAAHVQTLSVTDGSDLRVPSSQAKLEQFVELGWITLLFLVGIGCFSPRDPNADFMARA